ncbi:hypothetical protein M422DRAFT_242822 [Sphaerobolus stellatus SS14]|nr:hypothetical protein M422DRAFT_242822 [Sphaerobolus stellatus SS14]
MRNVDSDCIPAYPSPTALRGALRFQERHTHILPQRVTVKVKLRLFEAYTIFASILTSAPRKLRYRLPVIHLKPILGSVNLASMHLTFSYPSKLNIAIHAPTLYTHLRCFPQTAPSLSPPTVHRLSVAVIFGRNCICEFQWLHICQITQCIRTSSAADSCEDGGIEGLSWTRCWSFG